MSSNIILRDANTIDIHKWGKYGYGGNRRTVQIQELCEQAGYQIVDLKQKFSTTRKSRYSQGIKLLTKHNFAIKPNIRMISRCGYVYQQYQANFAQNKDSKIFLLEQSNNFIAYYAAQEANLKIVSLPQNLETLVVDCKDYFTAKGLPYSLESEIKHLKKADSVFCISREEQWLLKLRGINADFLPYYPPKDVTNKLLELRAKRINDSKDKNRFLILGSAHNKPTLLGMIEQLKWLGNIYSKHKFFVDIAGYDTQQLKSQVNNHLGFKFYGTVTSEELQDLMLNSKAILLHQNTGVGALTRIPEMLIAGIPVIANSHACRSAWNYDGVYCYENQSELAELMTKDFLTPEIPPRPVNAEKRFINYLNQIINE